MKFAFLWAGVLLAFAGCAVSSHRKISSSPKFGAIVRSDSDSKRYCPTANPKEVCLMTWPDALAYCRSQGAHLPTAREWADLIRPFGTKTLEKAEVQGKPPAGYYLVDCLDPDGSAYAFYMNHTAYRRSADERGNHLLWTASKPPSHQEYAHVYYDEWGGGGGDPKDHLLTHPNAVRCVRDE